MWLDADLDPDSEDARALMMRALEEAETGEITANSSSLHSSSPGVQEMSKSRAATGVPSGHTYHHGPPRLVCSVPWGLMLLREADISHPAVRHCPYWDELDTCCQLTVHVDWGNLPAEAIDGVAHLSVRHQGSTVASATGAAGLPLAATFSVSDAMPGEPFVAQLSWDGGSRFLHCLPPLRASLPLDGLLAAPSTSSSAYPSLTDLLFEQSSHPLPPLSYLPDRGIGIELELVTLAPDPCSTGCFTKADEVSTLLNRLADSVRQQRGQDQLGIEQLARLDKLLGRCALWVHETDDHVMFSPQVAQPQASV